MRMKAFSALLGGALTFASAHTVEIRKEGAGHRLYRDGQPFVLKGVAVWGLENLDKVAAAGGNTLRAYVADRALLDRAQSLGLSVLLAVPGDNLEAARGVVMAYKDHPALLMWCLGNELENWIPDQQAAWRGVESIAALVKQLDGGRHPVITALAEVGTGSKLADLRRLAPSLDAVGINAYGGAESLASRMPAAGWDKPFFVTEFGPVGHWEVAKTPWGLPLEPNSTEKAATYLGAYRALSAPGSRCLGAFAFQWGWKQEKTHTWYGMFLPEGNPLGPVDAMTEAWTGAPPANPAPRIGPGRIRLGSVGAVGAGAQRRFRPGTVMDAVLDAVDPGGPPPAVTWDVRKDVSDHPATGGIHEPPTPPIAGAVSLQGQTGRLRMPDAPGNYRIFAYAKDAQGRAATANVPVQVAADAVPLSLRRGAGLFPEAAGPPGADRIDPLGRAPGAGVSKAPSFPRPE